MGKRTFLYDTHVKNGAKIIDFFGWDLPLHYGSQLKEHLLVREDCGVFDVSHMLVTHIAGKEAKNFLQKLVTNDINKLNIKGKALYTPVLNELGGIIDDIIIYRLNDEETLYKIVSNGSTREKDLQHFNNIAGEYLVDITPRYDLSMLAIQGPLSIEKILKIKPLWKDKLNKLSSFESCYIEEDYFVSKTGYTGEIGIEVISPSDKIKEFFELLISNGISACGLGARDTLRIEAGMNLYGQDINNDVSPLESGLSWTICFDSDFIGRDYLLKDKLKFKQVGLIIEDKVVLRSGMKIDTGDKALSGIITSGTFSPTLKKSIAIARVPISVEDNVKIDIRGKLIEARLVKLPFVRNGRKLVD